LLGDDFVDTSLTEKLITAATKARELAHSPYSGFKVGAALSTKSGKIYLGCNIENISFSLTNCAERTAIFTAVADGNKEFTGIVVITNDGNLSSPCGGCLQVMSEFVDSSFPIILTNLEGKMEKLTMNDFLPRPFTPDKAIGNIE
jgi:cytidine deaminase